MFDWYFSNKSWLTQENGEIYILPKDTKHYLGWAVDFGNMHIPSPSRLKWHAFCFEEREFPVLHLTIDFQCHYRISLDAFQRVFAEPYRIERLERPHTPIKSLPLAKSLVNVELDFQIGNYHTILFVDKVLKVWKFCGAISRMERQIAQRHAPFSPTKNNVSWRSRSTKRTKL